MSTPVEPIVMLRFSCEPRKGNFCKQAPMLPGGVSWMPGLHYNGDEFGEWQEVNYVAVNPDGSVDVWLDDVVNNEDSADQIRQDFSEFGWSAA